MELSDWKLVEPLDKGWSSDRKYRVARENGVIRLLRLADPAQYEKKRKEYEIIQKYARLGFPMSQPLDFGLCGEGVYMLLSWVEGEDLETVLPVLRLLSSVASLTRCASPPERVVLLWPSLI